MSNCAHVQRQLSAYVDGELDPATHVQVEEHTCTCDECLEHLLFERSFRDQVRSAISDVSAPAELSQRVRVSLVEAAGAEPSGIRAKLPPPRVLIVLAAAASVGLAFWPGGLLDQGRTTAATLAPMLRDVVRLHSNALPSDIPEAEGDRVQRYFRGKVEFPVRPARFERPDVRLVGARLSNVRERQAAALFYDVHGRRVTVVVFEFPSTPAAAFDEPFEQRDSHVFYQDIQGYTVPVRNHAGLSYAFAGDLDRRALLQLAASARVSD